MSGHTPSNPGSPSVDPAGTDDELSSLLGSIRRHVLDKPADVWDSEVRMAAKTVSAALAERLVPDRYR